MTFFLNGKKSQLEPSSLKNCCHPAGLEQETRLISVFRDPRSQGSRRGLSCMSKESDLEFLGRHHHRVFLQVMIERSLQSIFFIIFHFCMNKISHAFFGDSNRQVFNKLISVPSWAAAWEADKELHKKVQTLHEDTSTCTFYYWSLTLGP